MLPIVTDCLSFTIMIVAKTAEVIKMPFGMWTVVGPRKHVLGGSAHWRHLMNMSEPSCAVVMRPCVKLLWPLLIIWQTNSEAPHLAAYTSYIDHELKEADPVRVLCIFERAVVDNCLQPDLWIRYVKYVVCIGTFCCIYLLFSEREYAIAHPSVCRW